LLGKEEQETAKDSPVFLIEVDTSQVPALTKWLRKYRLRSKVAIRQIPHNEVSVYSTWDNTRPPTTLYSDFSAVIEAKAAYSTLDTRAPGLGLRILARPGTNGALPEWNPFESANIDQYTIRRYLHGVPEGQNELIHEQALVHESCIDYMGGVDFRKGCYVGQELVIRTQHTGVVRKRILPCVLYSSSSSSSSSPPTELKYDSELAERVSQVQIPSGADIKHVGGEEKKARSKGRWIGGVGNVGLALCRLEDVVGLGPTGEMVEGWDGSREWGVAWEGQSEKDRDLRLKAFVPEWWNERITRIRGG
jgi:transferase CAF17, mitochondrial